MMTVFSKSGQLYGKRRLPDFRQTLIRPGPYLDANFPPVPDVNPPSVDKQRGLPAQDAPNGGHTAVWPFGDITV